MHIKFKLQTSQVCVSVSSKQTYYSIVLLKFSEEEDLTEDKYSEDPLKKEMINIINRNDPTKEIVIQLLETFNREFRGAFSKNTADHIDTVNNATAFKGSYKGVVYNDMIDLKLNNQLYFIFVTSSLLFIRTVF